MKWHLEAASVSFESSVRDGTLHAKYTDRNSYPPMSHASWIHDGRFGRNMRTLDYESSLRHLRTAMPKSGSWLLDVETNSATLGKWTRVWLSSTT